MPGDIKKLTAREHIMSYPDAYLGSTQKSEVPQIGYDAAGKIVNVTNHIPAAIRAVKEILDNSADAAIRAGLEKGLRLDCSFTDDGFTVTDDGHGIPIKMSAEQGVYMPQLALGENRAGSNFEVDTRSTIGMYGVGAYCTNVVSTKLLLKTDDGIKSYKQEFSENCGKVGKPTLGKTKKSGTSVSVVLDQNLVQWTDESIWCCLHLLNNTMFVYPSIKITAKVHGKTVKLLKGDGYHKALGIEDEWFSVDTGSFRAIFGLFNGRSDVKGLVNGTDCSGIHISTIKSAISSHLIDSLKTDLSPDVTRGDISRCISMVASFRVVDPSFDSLTKTSLVGCDKDRLNADIGDALERIKNGLYHSSQFKEAVMTLVESRGGNKIKQAEKKAARRRKSTKLVDVYRSSRADKRPTYLLVTEGDSAKGLFLQARDPGLHAIYPLRGKIMNAISASSTKKVVNNQVLFELASILGLSITDPDISNCRYTYLVSLTDADADGDNICGLLYGFIFRYWPDLFKAGRVLRLQTPSHVGVSGKERKHFYGSPPDDFQGRLEYIKGLASLTLPDVKEILAKPHFETMVLDDGAPDLIQVVLGESSDAKRRWLS